MKQPTQQNKVYRPKVVVDPKLSKYVEHTLFAEKLERAKERMKTVRLPPDLSVK